MYRLFLIFDFLKQPPLWPFFFLFPCKENPETLLGLYRWSISSVPKNSISCQHVQRAASHQAEIEPAKLDAFITKLL